MTNTPLTAAAAGAVLFSLCACGTERPVAGAQAVGVGGPRECFRTQSVNGFEPVGRDTVNVRVGARDVYQLVLFPTCPDINWEQKIAIQSRGSTRICTGLDAELLLTPATGPQRCPVRSVRKLSAEEAARRPPG